MDSTLRRMRHFMENRVGKKNEIEWQELAVKNLDRFFFFCKGAGSGFYLKSSKCLDRFHHDEKQ